MTAASHPDRASALRIPSAWPALTMGRDAFVAASAGFPEAALITSSSPWRAVQSMLAAQPARVGFVTGNGRERLDEAARGLAGPPVLVGIGGGLVMDAAKYVARVNRQRLIQIPSSAANNACFTRTAWVMEGKERVAERHCPIPEAVIAVPELIAAAPARLNRAGFAEILCSHTALFDWALGRDAGRDVQWDDGLRDVAVDALASLEALAPRVARGEAAAFVEIVQLGSRFAPGFASHPRARFNAGSEHLFAWALEAESQGKVLHGEAVALGTVLMAALQGNAPERPAALARSAGLPMRPGEIGANWAMIEAVSRKLAGCSAAMGWYTVLDAYGALAPNRLLAILPDVRALVEFVSPEQQES